MAVAADDLSLTVVFDLTLAVQIGVVLAPRTCHRVRGDGFMRVTSHGLHEQKRQRRDLDGHRQIEDDRQGKGRQQTAVAARGAQQGTKRAIRSCVYPTDDSGEASIGQTGHGNST